MDEKSIPDLLSAMVSGTEVNASAQDENEPDKQNDTLVTSLKAVTGQFDEPLEEAVNEFLRGKGILHETTAAAITRGGDSGLSDVVTLLTSKFKVSPSIAKLIASLLVNLLPATKKKSRKKPKSTASKEQETSKTRKKPKKKTAASKPAAKKKPTSKPKPGSTQKKAKKKATPKPKKTASKPAGKKKPAAKPSPKETPAKTKPKKATRAESVSFP